eukprot:1909558-Pleurochrysis_carterae.AAC.3
MMMVDTDDIDEVSAAPGVIAGMETDADGDSKAPVAGTDDFFVSRVRRCGFPRRGLAHGRPPLPLTPSTAHCLPALCRLMPQRL